MIPGVKGEEGGLHIIAPTKVVPERHKEYTPYALGRWASVVP
jgi:hypothetical protein